MKKRDVFRAARIVFVAALLSFNAAVSNLADQTVVPNQYTNIEGPGGINVFFNDSKHVSVFAADLFSDLPSGGGFLEGVSFRVNMRVGSALNLDVTQEIEVRAGITSKHPHTFPQTDEFGTTIPYSIMEPRSDEVVFPRATIQVKQTVLPNAVNPFNIHIPFRTPYRYDPAGAHLYLDLRTFIGQSFSRLLKNPVFAG